MHPVVAIKLLPNRNGVMVSLKGWQNMIDMRLLWDGLSKGRLGLFPLQLSCDTGMLILSENMQRDGLIDEAQGAALNQHSP